MKKLLIISSVFILFFVAMFVINQTAQLVALANTVSPTLGKVVLLALLAVYSAALLVPTLMFLRMPKALVPPADEKSDEYRLYLQQLGKQLTKNKYLSGANQSVEDIGGIEAALKILDKKAETIIKETAAASFLSTAIPQNGRLDGLMVLVTQSVMIWQVARIYNQRPDPRGLLHLYTNVAATLFTSSQLGEIDIGEQIEPVIKAAMGGSVVSLIPGVSSVASIMMQAILEGTANAYLTLRVGIICQGYCRSVTRVDRLGVRKYASVTAAGMLGAIVGASAASVVRAIASGVRKAGESTIDRLNPWAKKAASSDAS